MKPTIYVSPWREGLVNNLYCFFRVNLKNGWHLNTFIKNTGKFSINKSRKRLYDRMLNSKFNVIEVSEDRIDKFDLLK